MLVSYRLIPINQWSWSDMPPSSAIRGVTTASVTKQVTDGSPLMDSATLTVSAELGYEFKDGWYRLEAFFPDENRRIPIMTMWAYSTGDVVKGNHIEISVTGTSVLKPLEERKTLAGDFIAKKASATTKIERLMRDAQIRCPIFVHGTFELNDYYVFDYGTTYLDIIWGLLKKAGWCMQVYPDGAIHILKKPEEATYRLGRDKRNLIMPQIGRAYDKSGIPNRLKVIDRHGIEYVVENHQKGSKTSYEARGRWVDAVDTAPQQKDGESLQAYARRQMEELSTWAKVYTFDSHWIDGVYLFSLIEATLPNEGIAGKLRVTQQNIECGKHLKIGWTVGEEIKEYTTWKTVQSAKTQSPNS